MQYYCEICDIIASQKSHIESHLESKNHKGKALQRKNILRNQDLGAMLVEHNIPLKGSFDNMIKEIIIKLSTKQVSNSEAKVIDLLRQNKFNNNPNASYDTKFSICHEPTQFTLGKTQQTLDMLSNVIEKYYLNSHSNDFHQIQIIVTNNSLLETQQWKIRTKNKLDKYDYVDVDILSSKTDSDYKYMSSFSEKIRLAETS